MDSSSMETVAVLGKKAGVVELGTIDKDTLCLIVLRYDETKSLPFNDVDETSGTVTVERLGDMKKMELGGLYSDSQPDPLPESSSPQSI